MKTIKLTLVVLFLSTLFVSCETDSVNDEIGIEVSDDSFAIEDDPGEIEPEE